MAEKAILTLRSGERVELFPLEGHDRFGSDLYQALERLGADDGAWVEGRDAAGHRLRVRALDVSTVRVVPANPAAPGVGGLFPPAIETKADPPGGLSSGWR